MSLAGWLLAGAFAAYYPSLVFATLDGPFGIFDRWRQRWDTGYRGKAIRCPVCISAYMALLWAGLLGWRLGIDPWLWPVVWFALAGGATFLNKVWLR